MRSVSEFTTGTGTDMPIPKPAIVEDNYLLLLLMSITRNPGPPPVPTPPLEFVPIAGGPFPVRFTANSLAVTDTYAWLKPVNAASDEPAFYITTHANATRSGLLLSLAGFKDQQLFSPGAGVGNGVTATAPSITTLTDGSLVILVTTLPSGLPFAQMPPEFTFHHNPFFNNMMVASTVKRPAGATGAIQTTNLNADAWSSAMIRLGAYDTRLWVRGNFAPGDGGGA